MQYSIPDYYKEFECLADRCEDTCCAGWQIVIDKKSLKRYKAENGNYRKKIRESVDFRQGTFNQGEDKRCAFLNDTNLCDMYLNLGKDSLCRTCRMYPRHVEEFENVREITLSISCPEVARILLEKKTPVTFLMKEKSGEEEYENFDPFLYSELVEGREVIKSILQDRSKSIETRAVLVLGLAHDMQVRICRNELFACEEVLKKYQGEKAFAFVESKLQQGKKSKTKRYVCAKELFETLFSLELLRRDWHSHLIETGDILFGQGVGEYNRLQNEFEVWISECAKEWPVQCEQLLVYFIYTYFCGGVYDGRIYDKANMAVVSVFLIYEMLKALWYKNSGQLNLEDVIMVVYRFSREIEHSDINICQMEKSPSLLQFF